MGEIITQFLANYGQLAVFLVILVEYLGLPLPTELAYVAAGQMIDLSLRSYPYMFGLILVAHLMGAVTAYELGVRSAKLAWKKQKLNLVHVKLVRWYHKYGPVTVFLAQLVGHIRPWASYVAGFAEIPRPTFLLFSVLGSALMTGFMLMAAEYLLYYWEIYPWFRGLTVGLFVAGLTGMVAVALADQLSKWRGGRVR